MPFLGPLVTAASGALAGLSSWLGSSTILAGIARFGLGLAAKYALGSLLGQKPQAQASQLETTYGENLTRTVAMGRVGVAGQLVYRNAYGSGNRTVQDVYVLSHFRVTGITRVRYKGEWKTLGGVEDPFKGFRILDIDAEVWVKLYKGTMTQVADAHLINMSNPPGRWTSAHRGAGVAYAVVTNMLDREKLQQPWAPLFELQAAPLYDWRKDSSVGGTGAHRWADQSTWEFSENPVLMMYALERGIINGTEMMVGKGAAVSRLPLDRWTLAANICDEIVEGKKRYTAALIAAAGASVTHDQNMQPLLEACAATWVEDASGEYPIIGAAQPVAFTFADDDIMVDESFRVSLKRTKSELINTITGTFLSADKFYEATPLATRIDTVARAEDGERLATSVPYTAVNEAAVADRLLDIAFKASRYQANGEVCLHPRFLQDVRPGIWCQWNSATYGTRKFQVIDKRLGAFGEKAARNVYVTLQEVGDGIFDRTAYVTIPTVPVLPGEPDYAVAAANFRAVGVQIKAEGSTDRKAGIRFSWDAFADITVVAVDVEYRPEAVGVAVSIANPAVITWPSHGLAIGDICYLATTGALPTGLTPDSPLYVVSVPTSGTITVSLTPGGPPIATSGTQSGIHSGYVDSIVKRATVPVQVLPVTEGVLPNKTYEYRHRIIADPPRATFFTAWQSTSTPADVFDVSVGLAQQQADVIAFLTGLSASLQEYRDKLAQLAAATMEAAGRQVEDQAVAVRFKNAAAAAFTELNASIDEVNGELVAQATAITGVQAQVGDVSAGGLFRIRAVVGAGDVVATLVAEVRATAGDAWVSAGMAMEAGFVGGNPLAPFSNFIINANKFVVTDGSNNGSPLTFEGGELKLQVGNIGLVKAGRVQNADGSMVSDYNLGYHSLAVP